MIRYEIKKIFSKSLSKVSLVVLLFSLLISCYFAITNVSFLDEQGKSHTGIAAAKSLREEKQKWKGVLDEAALQAVLDEYKKISEEYPIRPGDDSANLLHDSKVQGFSEIKDMINMGFCEFRDFNYYRIDSLSKEEVGQIYENRGKSLEKWLNSEDADGLFDENEKAFLIEQYREMKAPLYYEDYDGWKSALSYAQTIIMLIMLVSAFLVSGIFSNEFSWKSDSIFFSTKYGRDRGTRAKIMAGFIVVSVIYFIVISLYGWELVLVNRDNYIPDDYEMDLMELSNGQKIDSRIYPYLQEMFDDARNAGVYPFVRDGYRTAEEQQQILDDKIAAYRSEGYTKHMAEETAMEWGLMIDTCSRLLSVGMQVLACPRIFAGVLSRLYL